jgi:hypothetical protein
MSELYGGGHRFFQDQHGTRPLADRLEALAHSEFDARDRDFIEQVNMFFLATLDERGRPTVSYKGGARGFVRIIGPNQLVFPVYDGNGMFLSLGNIAETASVGMLFIDFEAPRRLRVQGIAKVLANDNVDSPVPGAIYLVQVTAQQIFVNCGRYIHKSGTQSPHVPDAEGRQPFPDWKRLDLFTGALTENDQQKVADAGGPMSVDDYRGES